MLTRQPDQMTDQSMDLALVPEPRPRSPSLRAPIPMDDSQCHGAFRWTIINFSQMEMGKRHYSDVFNIGRTKWQVLLYGRADVEDMSMYLRNAETLDFGWSRHARFALKIISPLRGELSFKREAQYKYHRRVTEWGFQSFLSFKKLANPEKGFLIKDTLTIEADVSVSKVIGFDPTASLETVGGTGQELIRGGHVPGTRGEAVLSSEEVGAAQLGGGGQIDGVSFFASKQSISWSDMEVSHSLQRKRKSGEEKVRAEAAIAARLEAEAAAAESRLASAKATLEQVRAAAEEQAKRVAEVQAAVKGEWEALERATEEQKRKVEEEWEKLKGLAGSALGEGEVGVGDGGGEESEEEVGGRRDGGAQNGVPREGEGGDEGREAMFEQNRGDDDEEGSEHGAHGGSPTEQMERGNGGDDLRTTRPQVDNGNGVGVGVGDAAGDQREEGGGKEVGDVEEEDRPLAEVAAEMPGGLPAGTATQAPARQLGASSESTGPATGSPAWWKGVADVAGKLASQCRAGTPLTRVREVEDQMERFEQEAKRFRHFLDRLG